MAASTSKKSSSLDKLYTCLPGYEVSAFTGADKKLCLNSFTELTREVSKALLDEQAAVDIVSLISTPLDNYLTSFYNSMKKCDRPKSAANLAEKAKEDEETLDYVLNLMMIGEKTPVNCIKVKPCKCDLSDVEDISDFEKSIEIGKSRPYYLSSNNYCVLYQVCPMCNVDESKMAYYTIEQLEGANRVSPILFQLGYTKNLFLCILRICHYLIDTMRVQLNDLSNYRKIFDSIMSASHLFEGMNKTGSVRKEQFVESIEMLSSQPIEVDEEAREEYFKLMFQVFDDIKEGKREYVKEISKALTRNQDYIHSKFDYEKDSFMSLKASSQKRRLDRKDSSGKFHFNESIISSIYEVDWNADLFKDYDDYIGYKSPYMTPKEFFERYPDADISYSYEDSSGILRERVIRTIIINNPGKFKGRIIHISDNPTQDRCNYIQNRMYKVLCDIGTDCTIDQNNGRAFIKNATLEWYISPLEEKRGLSNFDFSNATDTLDQQFQYEVLKFVFGKEVANFWQIISELPKIGILYDDNGKVLESIPYSQHQGQPQGLESSFVNFAFAHHIVFLIDMLKFCLQHIDSRRVYRVLGDDSAMVTALPEINYFNPDSPELDDEGVARNEMELFHMSVCRNLARFKINYTKSSSVHFTDNICKLDFAKTTYSNGELSSPVPFRLASNYAYNDSTRMATILWRAQCQDPIAKTLMSQFIEDRYQNDPLISGMIHCGVIPQFDFFRDNQPYSDSFLSRVAFCTAIMTITVCLSTLKFDRKVKSSYITADTVDRAFRDLFDFEKYARRYSFDQFQKDIINLPSNHKVVALLSKNNDVHDLVNQIYELDTLSDPGFDDALLKIMLSPLNKLGDNVDTLFNVVYDLLNTSRLLKMASKQSAIDTSLIFPSFDMDYKRKLTTIGNCFSVYGVTKKPPLDVALFQKILSEYEYISQVLGPVDVMYDMSQIRWH